MRKQNLCKYLIALCDFSSFIFSFVISILIIQYLIGDINDYFPKDQIEEKVVIHLVLSLIGVAWFWIRLRHYTYRKPFWSELKEMLRTLAILAVVELATIAFSKLYFSRYLWVLTWIITLFLLPFLRVMLKNYLIKTKIFLKDTIIIGGGQNAIDAYYALMSEPYLGLKVKYFIALNKDNSLDNLGVPIINEVRQGIWELVTKESDQFIIALEDNEIDSQNRWLRYLSKKNYRSISVIPTLRGLPLYSTNMSFLFSYEVMLLRVNNNLAKRSSRIMKRCMDIFGSLALIIILSPLLLSLYLLIRRDGGNAIYGHERVGQNKKLFKCLKFRSMVLDSDKVLDEILASDSKARAEWEKDFKLRNDPRITPIGAFIRRTSLDELPQLFNVLIGQMSLVGPRPVVMDELAYYKEDVDYYLMAKPGMTGLWQVSGRNNVDYDTRVYFDSWYVKNWSLWNDIAILFKTIQVVRKENGAY